MMSLEEREREIEKVVRIAEADFNNARQLHAINKEVPRRVEMVILKNRTGKTGGHIFFKYNAMFNSYQACTEQEAAIPNNFNKLFHSKEVGKPIEAAVRDYTVDPVTGLVTEKKPDK